MVARQLTENQDDMVYSEEKMSFVDFTVTGDYSDYNILEEERGTIIKNDDVWVKTKK